MNNYDTDYVELVNKVIDTGFYEGSRAGDTYSLPNQHITVNLAAGFPILTTRQIFYKGVFGELAAFVRGAETLAEFEEMGCNYWKANAAAWDQNKGKPESEWRVGKIYGSVWRDFHKVDQLVNVIHSLKNDPYSRRHILTTWDPSKLKEMCLPPCHLLCQFYVREGTLHTHVYMRSVDLMLGLPSDMVLYALLAHLIAKDTGLVPGTLSFSFGDCHIYACHEATWQTQKDQLPFLLPMLLLEDFTSTLGFRPEHAELVRYTHNGSIKYAFCA